MRWSIHHRRSLIHITFTLVVLLLTTQMSHGFIKHLSHREARKLVKLALAASFFTPPGVGVIPIPLPFPIPFSIESVKPPIIHPFHPGFPIFSHGGGGFGGGGFGGGGFGGGGGGFYGRR